MNETLITLLVILLTFMVIIGYVEIIPFLGTLIVLNWLLGGKRK